MKRSDFILKRMWLFLFWPFAALLTLAAARLPSFAEWYALHPYRWISLAVNRLTSLAPFSIAEFLCYFLAACAVVGLVLWIVRLFHRPHRGLYLYRTAVNLVCFLGAAAFWFASTCGVNYYRRPFAESRGLEVRPSSVRELEELCQSLAGEVNRLRGQVHVDEDEVMGLRFSSTGEAGEAARLALERLAADCPAVPGGYGPPKPVLASRAMSACQITGIFIPFTFEANVNVDIPAYALPLTMCHELAHMRGFMREDEANFIGYLACKASGDADFAYSGNMLAFTYATNALAAADPAACQRVFDTLHRGVLLDLQKNTEYWSRFEGPIAEAANAVNDTYLKANRQSDGVKSYGRMVDLLLAEHRAGGG